MYTLYRVHFKQNNDEKSGIRYGGGEKVEGKGWVLSGRVVTKGNIYSQNHVYELQGEEDRED